MIWFTADHHFSNEQITGHVGRKLAGWERTFRSADEMDRYMISRWNELVGKKDTVYYLGDFTLMDAKHAAHLLTRLNGHIKFVPGGHDLKWLKGFGFKKYETGFLPAPFNMHEVLPMLYWFKFAIIDGELRYHTKKGDKMLVLCHYPLYTWEQSHYGSWHLHGHSHGGLGKGNRYKKVISSPPKTLEDGHSMDVGVDAWEFYPVHMSTVIDKLGNDE